MIRNTTKWLALLAIGGIPLVTAFTCDPATGFDFLRYDDDDYYDDYYYDDWYYYDDCYFECW